MSLSTPTDEPSELFTWKIEKFPRQRTKRYSKIFHFGGYKWQVLLYPKGYDSKDLAAFLAVADPAKLPYGWNKRARFSIYVVNQSDNAYRVGRQTENNFNAEHSSWGFTNLLPLVELNDPLEGFLVDDTIVLEVCVTIPESGFEPNKKKMKMETGDNRSVEADITGTPRPPPQSMLQSILGSQMNFVDASSEATATVGKVRFLSYWVSSEAFLLLEKIHCVHDSTFVKFSIKVQALQTVLLESFASFIVSMSSTKVNDVSEEALRLAALSIEDFEQVGLDLRWLKERLEEAKTVKKYSESVNTVDSCGSALEVARGALEVARGAFEVARAKVRELEEGLANAKAEVEVMSSRELPKSVGVNDFVLKDIV